MTKQKEELKKVKKEFEKKLKEYIRDVSIGQYNDKGVNIGYKKADDIVWSFIEKVYSQAHEEGKREERKRTLNLPRHTFQPVGGLSNVEYVSVSDITNSTGKGKK